MIKKTFIIAVALALVTVFSVSAAGGGQAAGGGADFPSRPMTIYLPWAAGGSSDMKVRTIAELGPKYFGQPMVVVNRDGAGGTIGAAEFTRRDPDGYNICMLTSGIFATQPFMREVHYEMDDFEFIIGLSYETIIIIVHKDAPWNTLQELIADGRRGRRFLYGGAGIGSMGHLSLAAFFKLANLDAEAVAFAGGGPTVTSLMGRHIDVAAVHPAEFFPFLQSGEVKMLGIFSPERDTAPDFRNVPTMKEQGYDLNFAVSKYFVVPRGTPQHIQRRLHEGFSQILSDESFVRSVEAMRLVIIPYEGQEVRRRLIEEARFMSGVLRDIGLID